MKLVFFGGNFYQMALFFIPCATRQGNSTSESAFAFREKAKQPKKEYVALLFSIFLFINLQTLKNKINLQT
jgi:hypothetical protein